MTLCIKTTVRQSHMQAAQGGPRSLMFNPLTKVVD